MKLAYPVDLLPQEDGSFLVSFPDIPEALTDGRTKDEALSEAVDCLIAALGVYVPDTEIDFMPNLQTVLLPNKLGYLQILTKDILQE